MMKSTAFWICIVSLIIGAYCAFVGVVMGLRNFLIFPAPKPSYNTAEIFLEICNGEKIAARFLPAKKIDAPVILYSHGNGEDLGEIAPVLEKLNAHGFAVLAYDYVGYGQSKGKPNEEKIYWAADAAWNYLVKEKKFAANRIVIMGYSLGSAAASHLAQKHDDAKCLILSGGFASGVLAVLPLNIIPFKILDNTSKLSEVEIPTLIIHGTQDFIVHPRNAEKNFNTIKSKNKKLLKLKNCGHYNYKAENYFDEIVSFINNV